MHGGPEAARDAPRRQMADASPLTPVTALSSFSLSLSSSSFSSSSPLIFFQRIFSPPPLLVFRVSSQSPTPVAQPRHIAHAEPANGGARL